VLGANDRRLYQLWVENVDSEPHTVHLAVEYDGRTVYRSSNRLAAAERVTAGDNPYTVATGEQLDRDWPEEPGHVVIKARLDDQSAWKTLDLNTLDAPCYAVIAHVDAVAKGDTPNLTLLSTADCSSGEGRSGTATTPTTSPKPS